MNMNVFVLPPDGGQVKSKEQESFEWKMFIVAFLALLVLALVSTVAGCDKPSPPKVRPPLPLAVGDVVCFKGIGVTGVVENVWWRDGDGDHCSVNVLTKCATNNTVEHIWNARAELLARVPEQAEGGR